MKKTTCQRCEKVAHSGVYLDTKNIGQYPSEVTHTYTEIRCLLCGNCYLELFKWYKNEKS